MNDRASLGRSPAFGRTAGDNPELDRRRWYLVVETEPLGYFLDVGLEVGTHLRFVFKEHAEMREATYEK